jgi:hypothetical protein
VVSPRASRTLWIVAAVIGAVLLVLALVYGGGGSGTGGGGY